MLTVTEVGQVAIAKLDGRVDAFTVREQRPELLALLAAGRKDLIIDLSDATFLDSAALAMIVSVLKRARSAGGDLQTVQPRDESVQRILKLTRLDQVLDLKPTREAALAKYAA